MKSAQANVFADLEFSHTEERLAKAKLYIPQKATHKNQRSAKA